MMYTATSAILKKLKTKGDSIRCARCGEPIKTGDLVISRPKGHRQFHAQCFEKLYVDVED